MTEIKLGYGGETINWSFDAARFEILAKDQEYDKPLSDQEINAALDAPIDSDTLENIVNAGESVLIVVPDATRQAASGATVNLLVRRLIANGTMPFDIRIIFATGIHRAVTEAEKREIVTPFIFQRIKTLDHNARDLVRLIDFGTTKRGTPVSLDRALVEHDKVILVGGVTFHYFAGFTGSRKLICPGLAASRTVNETHKLAFDFAENKRRAGVGIGLLKENPVHEEFVEIAEKINPSFVVNSIVNDRGEALKIFAGNWQTSHEKACEFYSKTHSIEIAEKREVVVVSCGGDPHDLNLIQAHKALDMAAQACEPGGTIVWLAECRDGLGRKDFLDWFKTENSEQLAENLGTKFQVNGQTAWSLLSKAELYNVQIITNLPEAETRQMRLKKVQSLEEGLAKIDKSARGYILPFGAKYLPNSFR
jgi:nickel-dependent lactate racemase